jgi:TolB protein
VTVRRASLIFFAGLSSLSTVSAWAQQPQPGKRIVIEIGNPDFRPYPIAVPNVKELGADPTGKIATEITEVLRWDLGVAPMFKVLDPKGYLADPNKEGMSAAAIKFSDWLSVGAEGLVKVTSTVQGNVLKTDFRFFDVASGREQIKKTYDGDVKDGRRFAHRFVNEIIYFLTGQKGVFGSRIAAVKKTKTGREIVVMDMDGKNRKRATNNGSINLLPAWSRDGKEILFTSYIRHNPNLYAISAGGDGKPRLLSGERGLNTAGVMSPDGKRIALTLSRDGNSEIYLMGADGTGLKRLTNEWAIDSSPSWSPDGSQIAFVSSRWGDPHIFVMNADGSNVRRITDRGTYNQTPDWSPRGDLIAFTARDERNVFDIFTVNPATKEIRRLTQDQGNNEEPSFSPDGSLIVFTSTREGGASQIWVMAADGSNQRRLTKAGGYSTPSWSPVAE